jgi:hypothetical protein
MKVLFLGLCLLLICLNIKQSHGAYLTVNKCENCTFIQQKFLDQSVLKTNETVAGSCFASFMLVRKFVNTEKNNEQVYQSLVDANVVVDIRTYYTMKRVLGYTIPGKNKIWINRKYMLAWNHCDLASLLGHESSHKIGYSHSYYATKERPNSVPYSINAAFKQCCVITR